jgi:hypothetical protein
MCGLLPQQTLRKGFSPSSRPRRAGRESTHDVPRAYLSRLRRQNPMEEAMLAEGSKGPISAKARRLRCVACRADNPRLYAKVGNAYGFA